MTKTVPCKPTFSMGMSRALMNDGILSNRNAHLSDIYEEKKELATYELVWEFGKRLGSEDSIIHWATINKIPVIVPGITDGMIGYQLWMYALAQETKNS